MAPAIFLIFSLVSPPCGRFGPEGGAREGFFFAAFVMKHAPSTYFRSTIENR
jgi:hypothetical protein